MSQKQSRICTDAAMKHWDEIARYSNEIIVKCDLDFNICYVSPRICDYVNAPKDTFQGSHISSIGLSEEATQIAISNFQKTIVSKQIAVFRFSAGNRPKAFHFETTVHPDFNAEGDVITLTSVTRDISLEVKQDMAIAQKTAHKELILDVSQEYIHADKKNVSEIIQNTLSRVGQFLKVDRAYLFQYNFDRGFARNTHEWTADGISAEIDNLQEVPLAMVPDWFEKHCLGEPFIIKDVSRLDAKSFIRKILSAQHIASLATYPLMTGRTCIGFVGFDAVKKPRKFERDELDVLRLLANLLANLHVKINFAEAIHSKDDQFKTLVEKAFGGLYIFRNERFTYVNHTFTLMTGYTEKELCDPKFDFTSLFHNLEPDAAQVLKERDGGNLEPRSYQFEIKSRNAEIRLLKVNTIVLSDEKGPYTLGIALDITDQKQAQNIIRDFNRALESKNKDLNEFAYLTSHNLRAPIANIIGLTDNYNTTNTSDPINAIIIDGINESTSLLRKSLDEMHQVLQLKSESTIAIHVVEFPLILLDICRLIQGQIRESGLVITTEFDVKTIKYNNSYIENIFLNMITNAIRYRSTDKLPSLHISSSARPGHTELVFSDNGIGIDLDKHGDQIFGIYQRFHHHPDSRGLGLYLVKSQLEKSGSQITVESTPGQGTTFRLLLKDQRSS